MWSEEKWSEVKWSEVKWSEVRSSSLPKERAITCLLFSSTRNITFFITKFN